MLAPISATYTRIAYPYANNQSYTGMLFENEWCQYKLFYVEPIIKIGQSCKQGEAIGIAQDITRMYAKDNKPCGMVPHVHFEMVSIDIEYLKKMEVKNV